MILLTIQLLNRQGCSRGKRQDQRPVDHARVPEFGHAHRQVNDIALGGGAIAVATVCNPDLIAGLESIHQIEVIASTAIGFVASAQTEGVRAVVAGEAIMSVSL